MYAARTCCVTSVIISLPWERLFWNVFPGSAGIFARDAFLKYTKRAHGASQAKMPAFVCPGAAKNRTAAARGKSSIAFSDTFRNRVKIT
jgi:hypothetical protein